MASGLHIDTLLPADIIVAGTNNAVPGAGTGHEVLRFNAGSPNKYAHFKSYLPAAYSGNGLTVDSYWVMATATSGDVDIDLAFERNNTGSSIASDSFGTTISVDNTNVPGTVNTIFKITHSFTNSQIDSLNAGESFRVKYLRDGINDTATGFLNFLIAIIKET